MLSRMLPGWLIAPIVLAVLVSNLIFWGLIVFTLGLIKLVLPIQYVGQVLHLAYKGWCLGNRLAIRLACANLKLSINGHLKSDGWYLLIANHQSSLDIVLLTALGQLPAPKFFLKDELKFVPFVGMGAWAMDMPFMKRVSKAKLAKNPKLKGMDVARTKKSCAHFRNHPTTIINFVEGSRFSKAKHQSQQSEYQHLLKPKAGGIAFALEVLGQQFDAMLNASIVYTGNSESILKDFFTGQLTHIAIEIDVMAIAPELIGDYQTDRAFRFSFQQQLNQIWQAKDQQLDVMKKQRSPSFNACMDESTT
ncbi:acyltransferase [Pseudoalteromonas tunicata]|uniref:Putative endonuclease n=1 Tax=Pseudoalteromonas tunicata D2 TaxID=87626 RepID=A4CE84_9GAMM|nr:acyltransferase [Pseudoalteromonas tunicata]ATC93068.1 hypothetical protein PTUN_a0250 [Pseudoalteromonas tunicata]AXT32143.1 acyltransferase [Pseudoalteromonas tunicata]EAR26896.1 putative endonuclease [Pseudoalteromonas tunicata D2]